MARRTYEIAFQIAGQMSSSFRGTFASATSQLGTLKNQAGELRSKLKQLDDEYKKGSIGVEQYTQEQARLKSHYEQTQQAQSRLLSSQQRYQQAVQRANDIRGQIVDTAAMAAPVVMATQAAIKFESSMADVKKVVNFDTPQQFKAMQSDIVGLSRKIPMAASGLAQIVAAGGQAGFARQDLIMFAESAAKMGVAFDISADQAGEMMAQWRTAFKMNQSQVVALADKINYLGNTTAAQAPVISDIVTRIGPLGDVGGVASGEIAALGATIAGMGVPSEIAATGIKNLILGMTAGKGATKSQAAAFAQLGMDAEVMAKKMQTNARGAILEVMNALAKLPKEAQGATLKDLFGSESLGAIAPLLTQTQVLEENFKKVADANQYAGSMNAEYEARSKTTANTLQLLQNNMSALAITGGSVLLPTINGLASEASVVATNIAKWSEQHPNLTRYLIVGATALVGLRIATLGFQFVTTQAGIVVNLFRLALDRKRAMDALTMAQTRASTLATNAYKVAVASASLVMRGLRGTLAVTRGAMMLLNVAFWANPIGFVIGAVVALGAVLYVLYKNFGVVRRAIDSAWAVFKSTFPNAAAVIENIGAKVGWLADKFKALIGMKNKAQDMRGLKEVPVSDGRSRGLPGHATGGIFNKEHIARFAEGNKPEAVIPLDGGSSNSISLWEQAGKMLGVSGGGGGISVVLTYAPVIHGSKDVEPVLKQHSQDLGKQFEDIIAQKRRVAFA